MSGAWDNTLPPYVISMLEDFDLLAFETFEHFPSWAIMYGTSSLVSHVAMFAKPANVAHMTGKGFTIEPIANVFNSNVRVLPVKINRPEHPLPTMEQATKEHHGLPYGWHVVRGKALKIISGRHYHYWRWKFFFDVAVVLLLLDLPIRLILGRFVFSWLILPYLCLVLFNLVRWRFQPLPLDENNATPFDILWKTMDKGGAAVYDAGSLHQQLERHRRVTETSSSEQGKEQERPFNIIVVKSNYPER